jgi:DNA processing protein
MSASTLADEAERLARVTLSRLAEPGDRALARLVTNHGATAVLEGLRSEALRHDKAPRWRIRLEAARPEDDLAAMSRLGCRFLCPGDREWPRPLDALAGRELNGQGGVPLGLWVRGSLDIGAATARSAAIVGSRAATSYGEYVAAEFAAGLVEHGFSIVSGAAYGIDGAAHRGCLAVGGSTVAVLANGLDFDYPSGHRALLERIVDEGAVVSELPPGIRPSKTRFLARNRIIAGLAAGSVVVEAALRSGAANTISWTEQLGRPALGVPGPITSPASAGVHQLIRQNKALFAADVGDVVEVLSPAGVGLVAHRSGEVRATDLLPEAAMLVLEALPVVRPSGVATIASSAGLTVEEALSQLGSLLLGGFAERSGNGWRLSSVQRAARRRSRGHGADASTG